MGWGWADAVSQDLLAAAWLRRKRLEARLLALELGRLLTPSPARSNVRRVAPDTMLDLLGLSNGG